MEDWMRYWKGETCVRTNTVTEDDGMAGDTEGVIESRVCEELVDDVRWGRRRVLVGVVGIWGRSLVMVMVGGGVV
jgi:hypothetical protein